MKTRLPIIRMLALFTVPLIVTTTVAGVRAEARDEARIPSPIIDFARKLETTLAMCDPSLFESSIDFELLLARGTGDLEVAESTRREFVQGLKRGFHLGSDICTAVEQSGSCTLLRVRRIDGEARALFRLVSDRGLDYLDFLLVPTDDGLVDIVDIFVHTLGEWLSQTARSGFLPLVAQLEKGSLGRLEKGENLYLENIPNILRMQALYREGRYQKALDLFRRLPAEVKSRKNVLMARFAAASMVGGEEYEVAMLDLKNTFPGDPSLGLVLIDHYFNASDYGKALRIVDVIDDSLGGDPYLDFLRANILYAAGKSDEARARARRAIERESGLEDPYWFLVSISLEEKAFAETAKLLGEIEAELGITIGDLAGAPEYEEFVESDAYELWLASRRVGPG